MEKSALWLRRYQITTGKYYMNGDRKRKILAIGGVELQTFSNKMFLGVGRGPEKEVVELDRRVEALYRCMVDLATCLVYDNTAARYQSSALEKNLTRTLVKIRHFSERRQFMARFPVARDSGFREVYEDTGEIRPGVAGSWARGKNTICGQRIA